ncbi:MAG: hypothetical protein IRZ24_04880 [Thermogemmatispora sp.]|uniref:hypothetical protein n=1 Tax=Thermogemmatispora sp. TaxID=1968838 RepID=UPI001D87C320|nr:hypothetical protein [Thermogemmatispora sp.]MBX5449382.1 hypothetical protein [Thermogemmatispora sp.]
MLISLTAALHLLLSRRQSLLAPIVKTQSDALLQLGSPVFQPSESQKADEAGKREHASPQIISAVTLHYDPNATSLARGPLHRDALPGVQASLLLTALEVAFFDRARVAEGDKICESGSKRICFSKAAAAFVVQDSNPLVSLDHPEFKQRNETGAAPPT